MTQSTGIIIGLFGASPDAVVLKNALSVAVAIFALSIHQIDKSKSYPSDGWNRRSLGSHPSRLSPGFAAAGQERHD